MVGKYWQNINGYEGRETCATCNKTELMSHILTQCKEKHTQLIWDLAKNLWPHRNILWPKINMGTILGCGCFNLYPERRRRGNQQRNKKTTHQGQTRLFQIILSKSAYLIWVLRCERVIQEKQLSDREIQARWYQAINERLTINKVTVTKIKRNEKFTRTVTETWEMALKKEKEIPVNWMQISEVLVGRTV